MPMRMLWQTLDLQGSRCPAHGSLGSAAHPYALQRIESMLRAIGLCHFSSQMEAGPDACELWLADGYAGWVKPGGSQRFQDACLDRLHEQSTVCRCMLRCNGCISWRQPCMRVELQAYTSSAWHKRHNLALRRASACQNWTSEASVVGVLCTGVAGFGRIQAKAHKRPEGHQAGICLQSQRKFLSGSEVKRVGLAKPRSVQSQFSRPALRPGLCCRAAGVPLHLEGLLSMKQAFTPEICRVIAPSALCSLADKLFPVFPLCC